MTLRRLVPVLSLLPLAPLPAQCFVPIGGTQPTSSTEQLMFDSLRGRTVALADDGTWEHDGRAWQRVTTMHTPDDRYEYGMTYDGARVLVYGGGTPIGATRPALDDLWAYDGVDWTMLSSGQGPGPRRGHAMVWDSNRNVLVLFGGTDMNGGFFGDTWEWNGSTWTQRATGGPGARVWSRMVFDQNTGRTVLFGGALNPSIYNDTWEWDGTSWRPTGIGTMPCVIMPGLVFEGVRQQVMLIGGYDAAGGSTNRVFAYDSAAGVWTQLTVGNTPALEQVIGAAFDSVRNRTVVTSWDAFTPNRSYYLYGTGNPAAGYQSYGQGCAGGARQVPLLAAAAGSSPAPGTTFTAQVSSTGAAGQVLMVTGLSDSSWNGTPLPLSLASIGMTGCSLLASADLLQLLPVDSRSRTANWSWNVPIGRWILGFRFFQQAMTLDASAANGIGGWSNGAAGLVQ